MPTSTTSGRRRLTPERRTTPERIEEPIAQRTRWARFLATVLPAPSPDRLVPVTEVRRAMVSFAEDSLADVAIDAVVQEQPAMNGDTRFRVLVAARDREMAEEVLAGI
jgi:hypothetical protein